VAWIAGLRIWWIRSWETNVSLPLSLAIKTNSTGHFAGERTCVPSSDCLCVGTNRMCPAGIWMRVEMLWWPRIAAEFHGVSSQTGRIKTTRKEVSGNFEEASAWKTALSISSFSYSGLAIHEPVQRYRNESVIAPKILSSGKAEQYEIPPIMGQLRGLPKSSLVVRDVRPNAC